MSVESRHVKQLSNSIKYRPDIDGLRGIAVLSVVLFHAFPAQIPGGFIGVDIFFVISGYLISKILYESITKPGFILNELPIFYARRIIRIFPSLITVLIASYIFGWFILYKDEFISLSKHLSGGATFLSNFILLNESGYFDSESELKPLLHLWSLGIEEQFYLLFPLLLFIFYKLRFNLLAIISLIFISSFLFNVSYLNIDPVYTFYSPLTRAWELMAGALLAKYTYLTCEDTVTTLRIKFFYNCMSLVGIVLLLSSCFTLNRSTPYP